MGEDKRSLVERCCKWIVHHLGFNISRTHDANFVLLAIKRAVEITATVPEWFHSDHGSKYASNRVQSFLESRRVTISMNPKSSPWCNGSQESFFGRFKVEFGEFDRFETYAELLEELYQQLSYFTFERIKTKLRNSSAEFRQEWIARQSQCATKIHSYSQVKSLPHAPSRPCGAEEQPLLLIA